MYNCSYSDECGRLCPHFVVSTAVTFADGILTINLPDTVTYSNREQYCFVLGQSIPLEATIAAPVVVTIGAGTTTFPLLTCCGAQVVVPQLRNRRVYRVRVSTTATGGSLTVLNRLPCAESPTLAALNDAEGGGAGA